MKTLFLLPLLLTPLTVHANAFSDVEAEHANAEAITYVQGEGIVSGYPDGTFKPFAAINRAEFTKIVIGAIFNDIEGGNCFPDVADQWFAPYVCRAKAEGIIGGYPDGTFGPEKPVSFAEAAKIIAGAMGLDATGATTVWYEQFVRALAAKNAIPTSIRAFDAQVTRGQMAEMIFRLHAKRTDKVSETYEELAGLPVGSTAASSASSTALVAYSDYPYTFPITPNWKDEWNFYIDEDAPPYNDEEDGVNLLAELDVSRVSHTVQQGGKFRDFLRVALPKGAGSFFVAHFYKKERAGVVARALGPLQPTDTLHLSYYVRFPEGYDFSTTGTLPGIGYGTLTSNYGARGSMASVFPYWSASALIGMGGSFDTDPYVTQLSDTKLQADNKWHRIDIYASMNTVPVRRFNGILSMFYDGEPVYQSKDVKFRTREKDKFDALSFYATIGGYDTFKIAPKDMHIDLAEFSFDTNTAPPLKDYLSDGPSN